MSSNVEGKTYLAFGAAVLIGGANFIAVSFSNQAMPPFLGAALRFGLAAALFFGLAAITRLQAPTGRALAGAVLYGLLGFGAAYALLYYALVGLPAGTASLILAAVPLITHVIAVLLGQERLSGRSLVGGLLVLAGIGVLSASSLSGDLPASYLVAAVLASIVVAGSGVVAKALPEVHPVNMNAYGMAAGTVLLAACSLLFGEAWAVPRGATAWLAVGWLVVFGSVGLFQLFLYVVRRWTASATVYAIAGMPLVAVALGALMLDQPVTTEMLIGGALVLAAVYVGAIARSEQSEAVSVEPAG